MSTIIACICILGSYLLIVVMGFALGHGIWMGLQYLYRTIARRW